MQQSDSIKRRRLCIAQKSCLQQALAQTDQFIHPSPTHCNTDVLPSHLFYLSWKLLQTPVDGGSECRVSAVEHYEHVVGVVGLRCLLWRVGLLLLLWWVGLLWWRVGLLWRSRPLRYQPCVKTRGDKCKHSQRIICDAECLHRRKQTLDFA